MAKVTFALLLLGIIGVSTALHNKCHKKPDGTRLAHPTDCTQFLVCEQHQIARISSCPEGLHFNRHLNECDFKEKAGCVWYAALSDSTCTCNPACCDCCQPTPTPTPTPTPSPTPTVTPTQTPTVTPTKTPTVTPTVTPTQTPTQTPTKTPTVTPTQTPTQTPTKSPTVTPTQTPTVTPTQTPTQTPTKTPTQTPTPTPTPTTPGGPGCSNDLTVCVDQPNNSTHAYEGYCNKWITCQAGCAIILTCPNNLQWVQTENGGYCDFPENISPKCKWPAPPPETGPSGISCANQGPCAGSHEGQMFSDSSNSNLYIVCQCECPISMKCPDGLVFNSSAEACDWPAGHGTDPEQIVTCDNDSTMCKGQEDGTLFPIQGSCGTFYKCAYGCAVVQQCPSGLHYDSSDETCNYVNIVKCPWPYTPPSGPDAGPSGIACPSGGRCAGQAEGTTYKSNSSCGNYVVCQCECEVEFNCPDGLYWDAEDQICNYPALVDCA